MALWECRDGGIGGGHKGIDLKITGQLWKSQSNQYSEMYARIFQTSSVQRILIATNISLKSKKLYAQEHNIPLFEINGKVVLKKSVLEQDPKS